MPSMPTYFVGKGHQFKMVDDQFGGDESQFMAAYDVALERIDAPLEDLAGRHTTGGGDQNTDLTDEDVEHFRRHWLGDWWRGKDVEPVLRAGYREAITRAKKAKKPLESIWVCANEGQFQVYICEGDRQFTVIVFTPPPVEHEGSREHTRERLTEDEPIWVVKAKDKDDDDYTKRGASDYRTVDKSDKVIVRQIRYART
jgi:hypothetical protein